MGCVGGSRGAILHLDLVFPLPLPSRFLCLLFSTKIDRFFFKSCIYIIMSVVVNICYCDWICSEGSGVRRSLGRPSAESTKGELGRRCRHSHAYLLPSSSSSFSSLSSSSFSTFFSSLSSSFLLLLLLLLSSFFLLRSSSFFSSSLSASFFSSFLLLLSPSSPRSSFSFSVLFFFLLLVLVLLLLPSLLHSFF